MEPIWGSNWGQVSALLRFNALINARLPFVEIDLGIKGFHDLGGKMEFGVWSPKTGFLNFALRQFRSSGYECSDFSVKKNGKIQKLLNIVFKMFLLFPDSQNPTRKKHKENVYIYIYKKKYISATALLRESVRDGR